jgi:hypothetical protein
MMRYRWIFLSLAVFFVTVSCTGQNVDPKNNTSQQSQVKKNQPTKPQASPPLEKKPASYKPGEILVKFIDSTDAQAIKAIQAELHLETIRLVSKPNFYLMKILDGKSIEQVIKQLQNYEEVKYSEPNYIRSIY